METQTYLNFCTTCFWVFTAREILTDASGSWREGSGPGFRCTLASSCQAPQLQKGGSAMLPDPLSSSE